MDLHATGWLVTNGMSIARWTRTLLLAGTQLVATFAMAWAVTPRAVADEPPAPKKFELQLPALAKIEDFAPPEEFVEAAGIKTHFIVRGDKGSPIVLVHGFGASTYTWKGNIDALAKHHRVYAFDMKGFGLSAKPRDGQYHMMEYTRHLLGFLDAMKLDKVILVGHSLGGAVAARFTLLNPDRVAALVLVAPAPLPMAGVTAPRENGGGIADLKAPPTATSRMLVTLLRASLTKERVEAGLKGVYHDPAMVTPELVEVTYRPITIDGAAEALASMSKTPPPGPKLPTLDNLKLPALVLSGAFDKVLPASLAETYAHSIPGAKSFVFKNSGHGPQEEEPAVFNEKILEFLGNPRQE